VLRRAHESLAYGDYEAVAMTGDLIAFIRKLGRQRFLVALNLGNDPHAVSIGSGVTDRGEVVLSTYLDRDGEVMSGEVSLRANEGVIVTLR